MTTRRRPALAAALTCAAAIALAACTSTPPEPQGPLIPTSSSSSPEPSAEPTADPREVAVSDASDAYEAYLTALNTAGADGFADVTELRELVWGQWRAAFLETVSGWRDAGITQVGEQRAVSIAVGETSGGTPDEGPDTVVLEPCVDSRGYDLVDPEGTSIIVDDGEDRSRASVTMVRQDGRWTVNAVEWPEGQSC